MSRKRYLGFVAVLILVLSAVLFFPRAVVSQRDNSNTLPGGGDWPMWRYDAGRTAASPHGLASRLHLQWVRELPRPARAWPRQQDDGDKLAFDVSYEPVIYDGLVIVPSMVRDSVTAYRLDDGELEWVFYADGPVRFAPAAAGGKVHFVSDDGYLYTLRASTGSLAWKHSAGPVERRVVGNERVISSWPARGGPVVEDGTVYYASGVWPFMGVFVQALDSRTGKLKWQNSSSGSAFLSQAHAHGSFGGAAPQGYLVSAGDVLVVPNGRSRPAGYRRKTGEFLYMNKSSRAFGRGWPGQGGYAVMARDGYFHVTGETSRVSDGRLIRQVRTPSLDEGIIQRGREEELSRWPLVDMSVAAREGILGVAEGRLTAYAHQPEREARRSDPCRRGRQARYYPLRKLWQASLDDEVEDVYIKAGGRLYGSRGGGEILSINIPEEGEEVARVEKIGRVEGEVWNMLAAAGRLLVVTEDGVLYCFGPEEKQKLRHAPADEEFMAAPGGKDWGSAVEKILGEREIRGEGYAVVAGIGEGRLIKELLDRSDLRIVGLDPDGEKVDDFREGLARAGFYGRRVTLHKGDLNNFKLPQYMAELIVSEDLEAAGIAEGEVFAANLYETLRPYGGVASLELGDEYGNEFEGWVENLGLQGAELSAAGVLTHLSREGPLPGSGSWTHQNANAANTVVSGDELVKPPFGVLWFGGASNENILPRHGRGPIPQVAGGRIFILGPDSLGARDVYTGRLLWEKEFPGIGEPYDTTAHQPGADHVGSPYVALEDAVYVSHERACYKLDPRTGDEITSFRAPSKRGGLAEWGYLGVWEDLLIAGLEPQFTDAGSAGSRTSWNSTSSERLIVVDRHDGSLKWLRDADQGFRHNAIAAAGGRLYVMDRLTDGALSILQRRGMQTESEPRLLAVDIHDGEVLWERNEMIFGTWLGYSEENNILVQAGRPAIRGSQKIEDEVNDRLAAYDGLSGELLWKRDGDVDYENPSILFGDIILVRGKAFDLFTGHKKQREHPLTGEPVDFEYKASSNCAQMIASSHLATYRRGTAAYYDLSSGGGTGSLGGFRAGCTPNLIAADGVLAAPDYTRTCICAYQLQTSLGLVNMPEQEFWTINAFERGEYSIRKAGINFGAPGDRLDEAGVLWMAYPYIGSSGGTSREVSPMSLGRGGTSPELVPARVEPDYPGRLRFQKHSMLVRGGKKSWVFASGLKGARIIKMPLGEAGDGLAYTVSLYFAEPAEAVEGERIFNVSIQGEEVLDAFDVARESGGSYNGIAREFRGVKVADELVISLDPLTNSRYPPVISGVRVVAE